MRRRDLLLASTAALAAPGAGEAATPRDEKARFTAMLDRFWEEGLARHPERATSLGLDVGPRARLRSQSTDASQAGLQRERAANAAHLRELATVRRDRLPSESRVHLDGVTFREQTLKRVLAYPHVGQDGFAPSLYVVSPITGAYMNTPTFLDTKQPVETAADAEAYLWRLDGFARNLDANTDRLKAATADGVVAPDFVLDVTLTQLEAVRVPAERSILVTSLDRRARAKGLGEAWGRRAARAYTERVAPALGRQVDAVRAARAAATHDAGCWRAKGGDAFYAANLAYTTTTALTPDQVHKQGLEEAKTIGARMDALLRKEGYTQGTLGERMRALGKDPRHLYPNTDAGKVKLVADLQARLDAFRPRMAEVFTDPPRYGIEVRRVPPAIENGAPGAYAEQPSLDGSRPGYCYFNLSDTAEWPRWRLWTTLHHEGAPGHQLQGGIALSNRDIPLLVRNTGFSGFGEGWALYAEQLADEMGVYEGDPLGRLGYLSGQIFRAGRLVVDTGMHHLRWSREQAIAYLGELTGDAPGYTTREIHRYCAIPAQACAYKIGHTEWVRLRERAKAALGPRFDLKAFHAATLRPGSMPLATLDRLVADWTQARMTKA